MGGMESPAAHIIIHLKILRNGRTWVKEMDYHHHSDHSCPARADRYNNSECCPTRYHGQSRGHPGGFGLDCNWICCGQCGYSAHVGMAWRQIREKKLLHH